MTLTNLINPPGDRYQAYGHNVIPDWCIDSFLKYISHHSDTIIIYTSSSYGVVALRLVCTQNTVLQSCALWLPRVCATASFFTGGSRDHNIHLSEKPMQMNTAPDIVLSSFVQYQPLALHNTATSLTLRRLQQWNNQQSQKKKGEKTMQRVIVNKREQVCVSRHLYLVV